MYEQKATGKAMTVGEIREFLAKVDLLELPEDTPVKAEVTIGSAKLKLLKVG